MEMLLLFGAGLVAGAINSLAGGGSFIAFPALLLAGVPPVLANATNTFAAWPGYVSGTFGYWPRMRQYRHILVPYVGAALVGGLAGAELLLRVDDQQFSLVVPWLMAVAVLLFTLGPRISRSVAEGSDHLMGHGSLARLAAAGMVGLLALICLYGGFFNAGLGIILLAFLALAGMNDIHAMNGIKLLLSAVVASVAIVRFAMSGSIAWLEGSLVFIGTLLGGFIAAKLATRIPRTLLRNAIIFYGIVLTLVFFWRAYG